MQIEGVTIIADDQLSPEEVELIAKKEIDEWSVLGKDIASIELKIDGNDVLLFAVEKSPIRRVRRITGYLSNIENFNDAKKSECHDRYVHADHR